ncbi:exonuclease V [Mycena sanguinolenta]|nr:exonuclease V [Mycena sanguinolenta]
MSAMPSTCIELEGSSAGAEEGSSFQRYRPGGTLSVTDLTSLLWCEIQSEYRMQQTRIQRSADCSPSFRAESNKDILVQHGAARNNKPTKLGQAIHKDLERELRAEEIEVELKNKEEQWAIRLINFLSCLVSLRAECRAREIPVFGIVDGVVVVGQIDELLIRDQSGPKTGTKRAADSHPPPPKRARRDPSRSSCEQELIAVPLAPTPSPQCIRLIDTKTRYTDSMPSDEDAVPARLQVLLYHRLLSCLIDTSTLFDFSALWALLGMQPSASFSPTFLGQVAPILGGPQSVPRCLEDMVLFVKTRLIELNLPPLDDTVQIIYLSQNKYFDRRRREKGKSRQETTYTAATCEDDKTAKAVPTSLEDMSGLELAAAPKENTDLAVTLRESADLSEDGKPAKAIQMCLDNTFGVKLAAAPKEDADLSVALEEDPDFVVVSEESADLSEDDEMAKVIQMSLDNPFGVELELAAAPDQVIDLTAEEDQDLVAAREESADLSEDHEIAKAIQMSFDDTFVVELAAALDQVIDLTAEEDQDLAVAGEESAALAEALLIKSAFKAKELRWEWIFYTYLDALLVPQVRISMPTLADLSVTANTDPAPAQETAASRPEIIGTKDFTIDGPFLDKHLRDALKWWQGYSHCQYKGRCNLRIGVHRNVNDHGQWPDHPAYWYLDESGAERLPPEDAINFGFPSFRLSAELGGYSWDASVYAGVRQFHQAKGFDPDIQDVSRHMGHPLYQFCKLYQFSRPFAHLDDQYSETISKGDNTSDGEDTSDGQNIARDLAEEELVDSTLTDSVMDPAGNSIDQNREEVPVSSTFKFVLNVQLSLIFFVVLFSVWSEIFVPMRQALELFDAAASNSASNPNIPHSMRRSVGIRKNRRKVEQYHAESESLIIKLASIHKSAQK